MQDEPKPPRTGDSDAEAAPPAGEARPKAKVILPKPPARGGAGWKGGQDGAHKRDDHHSQTNMRKPGRVPGRNG